VVELNYCNNSKRKSKNGGQDERKEGKKRKGKERKRGENLGRKSISLLETSCGSKSLKVILIDSDF
jgi:hypothetical protein